MNKEFNDVEKLEAILDYWMNHHGEHQKENEKWLHKAEEMGFRDVVTELKKVIDISDKTAHHIVQAKKILKSYSSSSPFSKYNRLGRPDDEAQGSEPVVHNHTKETCKTIIPHRHIEFHQIGVIKTPYPPGTPFDAMKGSGAEGRIIIDERFKEGLSKLDAFTHIIVIFYLDRTSGETSLTVSPPWSPGVNVGLFASRSPDRPNPVGMSVVRIKGITGNVITTEGIDVFDETPLIDVKPYIEVVDSRPGAGNGWIDELDESEKFLRYLGE